MSAHRSSHRTPFERLECRSLMSATQFDQTNLVSDQFGVAQIQDKHLINPQGIAFNPAAGAFWVANSGAGVATLYSGDLKNGTLAKQPLVVSIPNGTPNGVVNNTTGDFVVSDGKGHSGPAVFIFASAGGNITGWNPAVPPPAPSTHAQSATHVAGADFTGLAMGSSGGKNFIYATDFAGGKIDVFDAKFHKTTVSGSFSDSNLPAGFAPNNIQNLGGHLFVTYAPQPRAQSIHDRSVEPASGFVDEFSTSGHLMRRVASNGTLDDPFGLALAPGNFGSFSGDLLVGNLADGHISAFDPNKNFAFKGQLANTRGDRITIDGLRALQFGNGQSAGDSNALYFTADSNRGQDGLFGSIRVSRSISATPGVENGQADLSVVGVGDSDQLTINADSASNTTTVITDGRTQVFDHLFSDVFVELKGKHSHLSLDVTGNTAVLLNFNPN